jgi:DsbC/DsbD-like thiol-disulfide interchange protein
MNAQSEAFRILNFLRNCAAGLFALATLAGADARADWVSSAKSQARLIDGGFIEGAQTAAAQIRLSGAAITYWRDPGEAGVAPVFDFAGSDNVAEAKVLYPQPLRIDEAGIQAFGYRHEILFPIRVTPRVKDKPILLVLNLDYAVCEAICLPVHAQMQLVMPPLSAPSPQVGGADAALVAAALRQVPRPLDAAQAKAFAEVTPFAPAAPIAGAKAKPQWLLRMLQGETENLFIEAPQGFYLEAAPNGEPNAFRLTLVEHPAKRSAPEAPVRFTAAGPAPVEFDLVLPPHRP